MLLVMAMLVTQSMFHADAHVGNAVSCALLVSHFLPLHPQTGDDRKGGLISHMIYTAIA